MKLVKLKKCIHVYDSNQQKFVKLSAKNVREATKNFDKNLTKKEMIKEHFTKG